MSHRNMRMKFLLLILLVFSRILFSAEVKLRSENVFLCDIVEENPNSITILFKNQKYIIPRSEILAVNPDITGPHKSYQNSILTLEDNSVVKGLLVEETKDMVTIEKDKDLLAIPKNTIKELKKPEDKPYLLPDSYKVIEKEKPASSYFSMIESSQTQSFFRPAVTGEFGWQNSIADKYILRIGIRENGIYENPKLLDMFGLQISIGYRL